MNNLSIYDKVRNVPKEACKDFNNGSFSGTDINPMWRIKTLTDVFGPSGIGWYTEVLEHWSEEINGEVLVFVALNLYVKCEGEWSKPIYGVGGNKTLQQFRSGAKVSDEGYKMAYTDALSVAAKALGIGADIYWQTDPTKYTNASTTESKAKASTKKAEAPAPTDERTMAFNAVRDAKDIAELTKVWNGWKTTELGKDKEFIDAIKARRHELESR